MNVLERAAKEDSARTRREFMDRDYEEVMALKARLKAHELEVNIMPRVTKRQRRPLSPSMTNREFLEELKARHPWLKVKI